MSIIADLNLDEQPKIKHNRYDRLLSEYAKPIKSMHDLMQFCIFIINQECAEYNTRVAGLHIDTLYKTRVSNTHSCPIIGSTNFHQSATRANGYPGFSGRIWLRFASNLDLKKATNMRRVSSFSMNTRSTILHTGTGGYGTYDNEAWEELFYAHRCEKTDDFYFYPLSYDVKFFMHDILYLFPDYINVLLDHDEKNAIFKLLSNDIQPPSPLIFKYAWDDPNYEKIDASAGRKYRSKLKNI